MDKETLSNYGWITICVLVIAVMVALATPFGSYIKTAVENTTQGLYDTSAGAINSTDLMHIAGQSFEGSAGGSSTNTAETIPEGCKYITSTETITAGNPFPTTVNTGDIFETNDYFYKYNMHLCGPGIESEDVNQNGWGVMLKNNSKTTYESILETINGKPVTNLDDTFLGCTSLTTIPEIPNSVKSLYETFYECTSLTDLSDVVIPNSVTSMDCTFSYCTALTVAPAIPNSVTSMGNTFEGCTSLTTAPTIPSNVTYMAMTFSGCTSLMGTITIDANPTGYSECFYGCGNSTHLITLTGSSTKLEELKNTAFADHPNYFTIV